MSILGDRLAALRIHGSLILRPSAYGGFSTPRQMYVTREIASASKEPFPDDEEGRALEEMAAWLDAFSDGSEFSVSENCKEKPPETMLARVCPPKAEFWAIRVTDDERLHKIRVFGAFADKNIFVALDWDYRSNIGDGYEAAVIHVRQKWSSLFGSEPPHSGKSIDAYLTAWHPA